MALKVVLEVLLDVPEVLLEVLEVLLEVLVLKSVYKARNLDLAKSPPREQVLFGVNGGSLLNP